MPTAMSVLQRQSALRGAMQHRQCQYREWLPHRNIFEHRKGVLDHPAAHGGHVVTGWRTLWSQQGMEQAYNDTWATRGQQHVFPQ